MSAEISTYPVLQEGFILGNYYSPSGEHGTPAEIRLTAKQAKDLLREGRIGDAAAAGDVPVHGEVRVKDGLDVATEKRRDAPEPAGTVPNTVIAENPLPGAEPNASPQKRIR